MHRCLDILPDVTCRSPQESLKKYQGNALGLSSIICFLLTCTVENSIASSLVCYSTDQESRMCTGFGVFLDIGQNDLLFDNKEFRSNVFQRPFQYLYRLDMNRGLGDVDMRRTEGNPQTCLHTLLRYNAE